MSDEPPFEPPEIKDEDILWASHLLALPEDAFFGRDGTDPRQEVLKSMEPLDVAACPGSGKTTLLVAKLAILAQKWRYRTRGICVLSHTNAARNEIETKLGNTTAGRRLLSYPHFIGTIHAFVNEFLAMPWLRSEGYPIKMIDTDVCSERRWNALSHAIRSGLERNHHGPSVLRIKSSDFDVGTLRWGKGSLGTGTPTYAEIRNACRASTTEGYFCYDEMFVWAGDLMDKVPGVAEMIRNRFPLLFIDEAQDNSEDQSAILYRIFLEGSTTVIRQRFGDANQAIFDFVGASEATTDRFPTDATKENLPNSHRFGQKIADLADPLGIVPYCLKGQGPKKRLASGEPDGRHTIFLFDRDSAAKVLDAYGELLLETFSKQELQAGTFTALGQVHRPPEKPDTDKFPHHVGDYWHDYDPEMSKSDPKPQSFVQYIAAGMKKAEMIGESFPAVEKIAEGLLRLAGMATGEAIHPSRKYCHRLVLRLLQESADMRKRYQDVLDEFAVKRTEPTKETWDGCWSSVVRTIAETIARASLSGSEGESFLAWKDAPDTPVAPPSVSRSGDNVYPFSKDGKRVTIRVGSIHSVKGQTHTATLVLETFWYEHNLDKLQPWIVGPRVGWESSDKSQQKSRLKIHYVAMTRPTHLLCLAMKRSTFANDKGELDQELLGKLERVGWQVKQI